MAATATQHSGQAQEQPQPLRVIIIGAGIAGLTLAIVLRQNGHHAEVSEPPSRADIAFNRVQAL